MRQWPPLLFLLLLALCLMLFSGCQKSNSPTNRLPPLTHSGSNTMGCMVDGKLFIPQAPALSAYNVFFNVTQYGNNLYMAWTDEPPLSDYDNTYSYGISMTLDSVGIQQGMTYELGVDLDTGRAQGVHTQWANYSFFGPGQFDNYYTTSQVTGQTTITWYDPAGGIVAGTFWFDAIDQAGDTVHVREGRFDMSTK